MSTLAEPQSSTILPGPDGGTLLGFLCALGALAVFQRVFANESVRLAWHNKDGWHPQIRVGDRDVAPSDIPALFAELTREAGRERFRIPANPKSKQVKSLLEDRYYLNPDHVSVEDYAAKAASLDRDSSDFLAAIGGPVETSSTAAIEATAFCALGSSQQYFFKAARELSQKPAQPNTAAKKESRRKTSPPDDPATIEEHLSAALFRPWTYTHPASGMRWDTAEDRRHALRWNDPSPDPIWTERGANRLAIEALSFFPTAPGRRGLQTTAFSEHHQRGYVSWPVWSPLLSSDAVKSLVTHAEFATLRPRRKAHAPLGVEEVFRCERMQKAKQVNFSVAMPCLD